jgi:hypothetical protein
VHGLSFIYTNYNHEPPNFQTTCHHFLKRHNKSSFLNLQASILQSITMAYTSSSSPASSAPFWWLLPHLNILIFAPSTIQQQGESSIQTTIHDWIESTFSGDIEYLFTSAMQVKRLTQNSRSTYIGNNRYTQHAANTNDYSTAVALACFSQSIARIGPNKILHVNKLYTPPIPDRGHPNPNSATPH